MSFSDGKSILSSNGKKVERKRAEGAEKGGNDMNREEARSRTEELRRLITYHSKKYYDEDAPELEDDEFDALTRELRALESEYPGW